MDGLLASARALVRADTSSDNGTVAAVELLLPLYEAAGLPARMLHGSERDVSVLAGPAGAGAISGGLLLVTHLDTVPSGPRERWTETGGDPWSLTEKEGWLFGLGCADVKLDALCKIEAARRLRGRSLRRPFYLLGTFGEETGLRGARHFVQHDLFRDLRPTQVLCGEPSELEPISAHKGYAVVRATVSDPRARLVPLTGLGSEELVFAGKAAHSSTPHLGVNAIDKAIAWSKSSGTPVLAIQGGAAANVVPARCLLSVSSPRDEGQPRPEQAKLISGGEAKPNLWRALATASALSELWQEQLKQLNPASDARFDPPGAVGGLNVIESGDQSISITLDARLLPQHDPDALVSSFHDAAHAWVGKLGRGELTLALSVERNAGGMAMPDDSPLVRAASRLTGKPAKAKPTSTEAGIFARAGCEAIVIGPGVSTGNAHTANERIEIAQLAKAVDLYQSLIVELCGEK